jgi:O-acetylserine/cysteine efflux transporter
MHLLLVLIAAIWGVNYGVIKTVLLELPPQAFNALRMTIASIVYVVLVSATARTRPAGREWLDLAALGFVGQFLYQVVFLNGLARTSVANASLIIGWVPVVVALVSAALGLERLTRMHWIGIALSVVGIYFVVALDAGLSTATLVGDALTFGAVLAWAAYTLGARPLLARHSPLVVTGWSMAFGTLFYLPYAAPSIAGVDWAHVSVAAWAWTITSALLALNLSYVLWNTAVQRIGSAKTALYSNLVPVFAVASAVIWLGEEVNTAKLAGAALIILGVVAARYGAGPAVVPAEE